MFYLGRENVSTPPSQYLPVVNGEPQINTSNPISRGIAGHTILAFGANSVGNADRKEPDYPLRHVSVGEIMAPPSPRLGEGA